VTVTLLKTALALVALTWTRGQPAARPVTVPPAPRPRTVTVDVVRVATPVTRIVTDDPVAVGVRVSVSVSVGSPSVTVGSTPLLLLVLVVPDCVFE
jgi:hypothetical protein